MRPIAVLPLLAAALMSCVASCLLPGAPEEPAAGPDPLATATTAQPLGSCPSWECGSNSPKIDVYGFHDLHVGGAPNSAGLVVTGLWHGGTLYQLAVEKGRILAKLGGAIKLAGPALANAEIRLKSLGNGKSYAIRITNIVTMASFAKLGGTSRPIETYYLDVAELIGGAPATTFRALCPSPPARYSPDLLGMGRFQTLVFEGERIDALRKVIDPVLDPSWLNLGCAGHLIAKLAINGYTESARVAFGFNTTIDERTAFVKMLAGDYCGGGHPFTVAGQPLEWLDAHGYTKYVSPAPGLAIEARWGPGGATCLNVPRVDASPTALSAATFGGAVLPAIAAACPALVATPCAGAVDQLAGAAVISAIP
jgi:hypothetical protein